MARTIAAIQQQITDAISKNVILSSASSPSKTARWYLWTYIVAASQAIFEQIMDAFKADVEVDVSNAAPMTAPWLQYMIFRFQYDALVPQVIQFNTNTCNVAYRQYYIAHFYIAVEIGLAASVL